MTDSGIKKINILGDMLFPIQFQFLGILLLIGGFVVATQNIFIGYSLMFLALMIFTGRDGVVFYPSQKQYRPYRSFLLFKIGKKRSYEAIEKIFLNSGKYNQKMYTMHTLQHIEKRGIEFNVYVKLDEDHKIYLGHHKDKEKLLTRFRRIAEILNTPFQDNTI